MINQNIFKEKVENILIGKILKESSCTKILDSNICNYIKYEIIINIYNWLKNIKILFLFKNFF